MQQNFDNSLTAVLRSEGGYTNDPNDPGGATSHGVVQRVYDAYRTALQLPRQSVRFITDGEVRNIYHAQYWNAVQGDRLPLGLDYCVFDEGVNSGPVKSIKDLQAALSVGMDGQLGMVTLGALTATTNIGALINRVCDLRLNFLHRLRTWRFFSNGWSSRVANVRATSLQMLKQGAPK